MLTGVKHWDAWRSMSLAKTLDMEALMMSPILAVLTFVAWIILGLGIIKVGLPFETLLPLFIVMVAVNMVYVGTLVAAVVSSARSSILSNLGLLLATYPYAALVSLANLAAMILILRRGARLWLKTEKTGYVDKPLQIGAS
jgi:hypothetical protein